MLSRVAPFAHFFYKNSDFFAEGDSSALCGYQLEDGEGVFNRWSFTANGVIAENDFFGFRPLYYKASKGHLWLSEDIRYLIEPNEELNYPALAVFLRMGDYLDDQTAFKHIKTLPANSKLLFDKAGVRIVSKAVLNVSTTFGSLSRLKSDYEEFFSESIRKIRADVAVADEPVILPLSGGRDSRHILLELVEQGQQHIRCVTIKHQPPKSNEDFVVASLLANRLKLPHIALEQRLPFLQAELHKNELTSFCALEHSWFLPLSQFLSEQQAPLVFDGIGGDVLATGSARLNAHRLSLARKKNWRALADDLLGSEGYLPAMMSSDLAKLMAREHALDAVSKALEKYDGTANPIAQFYFWNRARRTIGSSAFGILGQVSTTLAPFLDYRLYALLNQVPAEFFIQQGRSFLHDQIIADSYSAAADIRYENNSRVGNRNSFSQRCTENVQQLCYFLKHRPAGINLSSLIARLPKRLYNADFHHRSAALVRIPLYLNSLEQVRQDGIV